MGLVIIPTGVPLTGLPPFASLAGQRTFDGRPWEEVRGVGGVFRESRVFAAAGEESLTRSRADKYTPGFSVAVHELAHVVFEHGLPNTERAAVTALHSPRLRFRRTMR